MYLKQVALSERAKTVEHGSTGQFTATKSKCLQHITITI